MDQQDAVEQPKQRFLDVTGTSLDEWLALMADPPEDRVFYQTMFPTVGHRDEFLRTIRDRPERQIRMLLRHFLVRTGSTPTDMIYAKHLIDRRESGGAGPPFTEYQIRLLLHYHTDGAYSVWEGIGWVLDLLPGHPRSALDVLDAFGRAYCQHLTDNYLSGLYDSMAIIRERYIVNPAEGTHAEATLMSLDWRQLELLCGALFTDMGYDVTVTPPSNDDGVDVIATRETPGIRDKVVVQVKKYGPHNPIEKSDVQLLHAVMVEQKATRGMLVTTGPVRRGARAKQEGDLRVEVVDRPALLRLLAEHCGADWWSRVDRLITMMERRK